jgi:hypothetical protein
MSLCSLLAYIGMLCFDLSVLAGCAYLVGWKDWGPWWFALAVFIVGSSSFKNLRDQRDRVNR